MNSIWIFWGIAAAFIVVALALVLPPLFRRKPAPPKIGRRNINVAVYRDQLREIEADLANGLLPEDQFNQAKVELEARLAQDAVDTVETQPVSKRSWRLAMVLAVLIPLAAVAAYLQLGDPGAIRVGPAQNVSKGVQEMVQQVEDQAAANPDNTQNWIMLANAYTRLHDWPKAIHAFDNLLRLEPGNADVWSHYAEALAMANHGVLDGKPVEMVKKSLEIDNENVKALELAGVYAYQHRQFKDAVKYWKQVVALAPRGTRYSTQVQAALNKAEQLAGENLPGSNLDNLSSYAAAAQPASTKEVRGTVSLAPALRDKVRPDQVLFLFARASGSSPGAPLAAIRMRVADLPARFQLNDSQAMSTGNTLSSHKRVTLVARISKTGTPEASPGDLEGTLKSVRVGSTNIKLVIDTVRK